MQNWYPRYHRGHEPHPVIKFCEVKPSTAKVIGAHVWDFKPNFKMLALKILGDSIDCGVR